MEDHPSEVDRRLFVQLWLGNFLIFLLVSNIKKHSIVEWANRKMVWQNISSKLLTVTYSA